VKNRTLALFRLAQGSAMTLHPLSALPVSSFGVFDSALLERKSPPLIMHTTLITDKNMQPYSNCSCSNSRLKNRRQSRQQPLDMLSCCRGFMYNYCMLFLCNNCTIILDCGFMCNCCMQKLHAAIAHETRSWGLRVRTLFVRVNSCQFVYELFVYTNCQSRPTLPARMISSRINRK